MKTTLALAAFLVFAATARAQTNQTDARWLALATLETGCRDDVTGTHGEVSRYQMMPAVWREATKLPLEAARNPVTALSVAQIVQSNRVARFTKRTGRQPTHAEWAYCWHCPSHTGKPNKEERDYAERFCAIISKKD